MIRLALILIFFLCTALAAMLDPMFAGIEQRANPSATILGALVGDSRRLFANESYAMADAYYHSGFYPTIFDHVNHGNHADLAGREDDPNDDDSFMGPPRDWVDKFGRHFYPTVHTHLHDGKQREILPWLELSVELDPKQINAYVTAAYWLRRSLHRSDEAERFLRQGLRANPDSYQILLALGQIDLYDHKAPRVARNVFELAASQWRRQDAAGLKPDPDVYEEVLGEIVAADKSLGNKPQLLADLQSLLKVAHSKEALQQELDELQANARTNRG